MAGKKVFITGMSGYLAGNLCRELDRSDWCENFFGMDVKKPLYKYDKCEFRQMDINDPGLLDWVAELKPDILIHLAYVVPEMHDHGLMHHINFDGSRNALAAAEAGKVSQVLVASSGTAYGAWPDNPAALKEDHALRANPGFIYAVDKVKVEDLCRESVKKHPQVIMTIIRPCVVYGPRVDNYISNLLDHYFILGLRGYNPPLQFVHEDDVAAAIIHLAQKGCAGAFNLAPEDTITMEEVYALSRKPTIPFPDWFLTPMVALQWALRIPTLNFSTAFLDYIRYPWVMDNSRIRATGFRFRYSSRETVELMLRAKAWLP